jgi:hypothetical protein
MHGVFNSRDEKTITILLNDRFNLSSEEGLNFRGRSCSEIDLEKEPKLHRALTG